MVGSIFEKQERTDGNEGGTAFGGFRCKAFIALNYRKFGSGEDGENVHYNTKKN